MRIKALLFHELSKFLTIGLLCYVINVGLFNLLLLLPGFKDKPLTSNIISSLISILVSYLGNNSYTFSKRNKRVNKKDALTFLVINLVAMLFSVVSLGVSRYILDLHSVYSDNIAANIIGIGLGTIFRYLCYKNIIYKK